MKTFYALLFSALSYLNISAQTVFSSSDVQKYNSMVSFAQNNNLQDSALSHIIIEMGKQYLGTPYVGGILDKSETENLTVNLSELDCVTFLESTLAISLTLKKNKTSFDDFCNELKYIRYRDGILNGYTSRLHYYYDWINNNEKKGVLINISESLDGKPYERTVNAMTTNRTKYPHLKDDKSVAEIKKVEDELTAMHKFYVPKENIPSVESRIQNGDLIALTTTITGMEIAHVGIAIHKNGRLHFMHASSINKKVEISEVPLFEMIKNRQIYTGIVVARVKQK